MDFCTMEINLGLPPLQEKGVKDTCALNSKLLNTLGEAGQLLCLKDFVVDAMGGLCRLALSMRQGYMTTSAA